jgi:hypothetical protein
MCDENQFINGIRVRSYLGSENICGECNNGINWIEFSCKDPRTGATTSAMNIPYTDYVGSPSGDCSTCDALAGSWTSWFTVSDKYIAPLAYTKSGNFEYCFGVELPWPVGWICYDKSDEVGIGALKVTFSLYQC